MALTTSTTSISISSITIAITTFINVSASLYTPNKTRTESIVVVEFITY
jgi:hypothetical protein